MNFKDLLLRAKDGDQKAKEEIFLMYRPLLFKESCVNGIFDEDLFQELSATLIHCIRMFKLYWGATAVHYLKKLGGEEIRCPAFAL